MADHTKRRATALVVANRLRLANDYLDDALSKKERGKRSASFDLFMAAESLLLAVMASENVDQLSRQGQHQLGAMADTLPDENPTKATFKHLEELTGYATTFRYTTPSGRIPAPMDSNEFTSKADLIEKLIHICAAWHKVDDLSVDTQEPAGNIEPLRGPTPADIPSVAPSPQK